MTSLAAYATRARSPAKAYVPEARRFLVPFELLPRHLATGAAPRSKTAVDLIGVLYDIERDVHGKALEEIGQQRRSRAAPVASTLHEWLLAHRAKVPDGSATARAIDYSLGRWTALTRYIGDARRKRPAKSSCTVAGVIGRSCPLNFVADTWTPTFSRRLDGA
jgi:hypothetical protein